VDEGLIVALACVLVWVLLSARLSRWSVTAPVLIATAGFVLSADGLSVVALDPEADTVKLLTEVTLALILFTDATQIRAGWFGRGPSWIAARLLFIGLPLCLLAGVGTGSWLFSGVAFSVVAVIAASLCATDAALSASVIGDERISLRLRQIINVESGLNDGLATPFVLFFVAAAAAVETRASIGEALSEAVIEIGLAIVAGAAVGLVGGYLIATAYQRGWSSPLQEPIGTLVIALLAYLGALEIGGNGFVAAFVAGVAFGRGVARHRPPEIMDFAERTGMLLSFAVWFIFGATLVRPAFEAVTWQEVVFALLSLTVVRMVPVAVSLLGGHVSRDDIVMIGWLGPRGLASIVFALLALDALDPVDGAFVASVVTITVTLSVVLHGLTAGPVAGWYAKRHPVADTTEAR
jgi:NhaP-type Na+/H+ or K+/H+ antiporter